MKTEDIIKKYSIPKSGVEYAYQMGYDCGLNGSNLTNCAFSIFSSPENTKSWEHGKRAGEAMKKQS